MKKAFHGVVNLGYHFDRQMERQIMQSVFSDYKSRREYVKFRDLLRSSISAQIESNSRLTDPSSGSSVPSYPANMPRKQEGHMAARPERETVINFSEAGESAVVATANRKLQNRLEGYGYTATDVDASTNTRFYEGIPKNYVRIQRPASETRVWTEEQKEEARERLAGVRAVRAEARAAAAGAAANGPKAPTKAAAAAPKAATAPVVPEKPMTAAERLKAKLNRNVAAAAPAAPVAEETAEEETVELVTPKTAVKTAAKKK